MSENPTEFHEHMEHAEHAAHENNPLITAVSITIAILAVITAIIGSLESVNTAGAIIESNKATLFQAQASDQWNFFQAKGIKKRVDELTADQGGPGAAAAAAKAKSEGEDQTRIQEDAKKLEEQRDEARKTADKNEARHPKLTLAAAMLQISIAISTVAIITKKRWPWFGAMILGLTGVVLASLAYLT
jgi:hypothetical protein